MAIITVGAAQNVIGSLAFHQAIVMAGNARTHHAGMIELTDDPRRSLMALGAFALRPIMKGCQFLRNIALVTGEAA